MTWYVMKEGDEPMILRVSGESTSPATLRFLVMPLYGPEEWFPAELNTSHAAPSEAKE